MNNQRQNFCRALSILNSLLIFVFILFLIERIDLGYLLKFGFIFVFLITGLLKIYFISGISGCLLEIISGEEIVLQFRRMHQNAKDLWQGVLIVFVVILLIDFSLFSLFPSFRVWKPLYFSLLETIAAIVLAQWTINKKYIGPSGLVRRRFKLNLGFLLVIIPAYFLELMLVRVSDFIHLGDFHAASVLPFILNYIHVFEFIFCSLYILDAYPEIHEKFSRQKEIFLVSPVGARIVDSLVSLFLRGFPPVFVVLKALSPKTYKFREFNRVIWHERYYKNNVLVCMTCFTSNCYEAYKIAKEFRKRGAKVVMGGPHVTCLPNEALAFCDSVVIGPAEGVWRDVVRDYENGTLKSQYQGPATEADYAQVHQELLNSPPYIIKEFLETMRGCKFKCHFCTIPAISGGQLHLQPVSAVIELIKKIKPHVSQVVFLDNNIYADPGYAKELFVALKPLKMKWQGSCTIDIAKNRETLKLARESGCVGLLFGYEISGASPEKSQGGKFAMANKYIEYTKIVKKEGINIKGHFIFGFDSDNLKALFQLWKFCFSIMPLFTIVSMLTPFPGSELYRDMLTQNRIISLNWRNYGLSRMIVRHPHMNPAVVSFFFPVILSFFLMTTSTGGLLILVIFLFFPHYGMVYSFFK